MFRSPIVDAVVVLVIALLILGPKRLPELGKGLGRGMREFKEGITGESKDESEHPPALSSAPPPPPTPPTPPQPAASSDAQTPTQRHSSAEVGSEPKP